jgi:predicted transcriptional regulator
MSKNPTQKLKMVRKKFGVRQVDLAKKMDVSPLVISDYEKGRRPSPGVGFLKKYILMLYELAQKNRNKLGSIGLDHIITLILTTIPIHGYEEKKVLDNLVSGGVK